MSADARASESDPQDVACVCLAGSMGGLQMQTRNRRRVHRQQRARACRQNGLEAYVVCRVHVIKKGSSCYIPNLASGMSAASKLASQVARASELAVWHLTHDKACASGAAGTTKKVSSRE